MICSENTFLTAEDAFPMLSAAYDGPLRYFTGYPVQSFAEGEDFQLKMVRNAVYHFSVNEKTIYSSYHFTEKDLLHILARKRRNELTFEVMAVCSTEDFEVFRRFRDLDVKLKAIRVYASMTDSQRKGILRQMKEKHAEESSPEIARVTAIAHKKLKFDLCADSFSPQERRHIRNLFLESSSKNKNDIKLSYHLNIDPCPPPLPAVSVQSLTEEMDKHVYALHKAKQQLAEKVLAHQPVLLIGSQRVCAHLASAVSRGLSIPLEEVDVSSLSSGLDLLGTDATFDKSDPGRIVESMYTAGTSQMIFLFSQLDNINTEDTKEGSCEKALLHILSPSKRFEDRFLERPISTEETIFIGAATSAEAVPEGLRNLFHVIRLPEYTRDELEIIARNVFLPAILEEAGANNDTVLFPAETLRHIADYYCEEYSAGRMKQHLRSLIYEVIHKQTSGSLPIPCSVSRDLVEFRLNQDVDEHDPRLVCHRNREKYAPTVLAKLQVLSKQLKNSRLFAEERRALQDTYALLSGLYPRCDAADFNLKAFYEAVHSTHSYMDTVFDMIAGEFLCAGSTPPRFFLSGPPGTGKSSVVQSLAAAVGWPVLRIPCNDPDATSLRGKIIRGLSKVGTAAILHLDEIDKMSVPAANDLLDVLDSNYAVSIPELDITLDLSHLIIAATGNDAAAVARACPALANRMIHIPLPGYTQAEKAVIARKYIIPRLEETFGSIDMTDHTLEFLLKHYCRAPGIRDVEQKLHSILRKQKLLFAQKEIDMEYMRITKADILTALGPPPLSRGNFPGRVVPGLARGLAVSADTGQGVSFAVETLLTPQLPEVQITGLAAECAKESVEVCRSFLAAYYPEQFRPGGIHVHFGEAAVPTDGPSAGAALVVAMLSAMLGKSVPGETAFTGEVDLHGNIFKVGGIRHKVQAACQDGCSRIFIPWQNLPDLDVREFDIEIIPVCHASEILANIFSSKLPAGIPVCPAV